MNEIVNYSSIEWNNVEQNHFMREKKRKNNSENEAQVVKEMGKSVEGFLRFSTIFIVVYLLVLAPFHVHGSDDAIFRFKANTFISDWLVCGPFPVEGGQNINTDYLLDHGGETGINPTTSLRHSSSSVPSGEVSWQRIKADGTGKLDFRANLNPNDNNIAYAAAIIECEEETPAMLMTGSNDRLKVWLNGKLVHYYTELRASGPDADQTPVLLHRGRNLLLAKVDNEGDNWWLYARF